MSKEKTIQGLIAARKKIVALARKAPPEKRAVIFLGKWSVQDLLAHLIGWDYANLEAVRDLRAGKLPHVYAHWNPDWAAYNAQLVKQYKRADWSELLKAMDVSHRTLVEFLEQIPSNEFEQDLGVRSPRGRNVTIAYYLQAEIDDEATHAKQIQHWLETQ